MGKDYSSETYKKSYSNEYVKSYKDTNIQKKLYDDRRKEYNTISKKLNDKPYSKSEKEKYDGLQSTDPDSKGRVKAEGERRTGRTPRPLARPAQPQQIQTPNPAKTTLPQKEDKRTYEKQEPTAKPWGEYQTETADTIKKVPVNEKVEVPPPYIPKKEVLQESSNNDYINPSSDTPPVAHLPNGKYRNTYTGKTISESEARRLLEQAGYYPKKGISPLIFLLICGIAIPLKIIGPAILVIWGASKQKTVNTLYEKRVNGMKYVFHMPATPEQIAAQSKQGVLYVVIGVVIGIIQMFLF